ncbi:hypothetical protein [Cohnella caldifontis]|uniref:hypothetical protein n=1 Tax=Cohnella caldifontis TaxID=3027471 RepID=UPI0023EA7B41|nr:hypothetical protein [Cohnella sp. YIM B05605]
MVRIEFGDLRVGTVSGSSGIFTGSNEQRGFKSVDKRNQAFGTVNGERFRAVFVRSRLEDRDATDSEFRGQMNER